VETGGGWMESPFLAQGCSFLSNLLVIRADLSRLWVADFDKAAQIVIGFAWLRTRNCAVRPA
jgi:hypothetical protein